MSYTAAQFTEKLDRLHMTMLLHDHAQCEQIAVVHEMIQILESRVDEYDEIDISAYHELWDEAVMACQARSYTNLTQPEFEF